MKGEQVTHLNGVYTAAQDPIAEVVPGDSRAVMIRYTHQLTAEVLSMAWSNWVIYHHDTSYADTDGNLFIAADPLPPPRLCWLRTVPCTRHKYLWRVQGSYRFVPATPGAHGAFPAVVFDEDNLPTDALGQDPGIPKLIDTDLPGATR